MKLFGAIDVGASSGRVIAGYFEGETLRLNEVHRFSNGPVTVNGRVHWDFHALFENIRTGLSKLSDESENTGVKITSIGIDTWAVDYGLLKDGQLIAQPYCYRDENNQLGVEQVHKMLSFQSIYEIAGIQFLPFNTIYQLAKQKTMGDKSLADADKAMLIPDLIGFLLTGEMATEVTNASTTSLMDARSGKFSKEVFDSIGINPDLFPPLMHPGDVLGQIKDGFGSAITGVNLVLVGSHDTASAVVGVPASESNFVFISSGTWSLLGAEINKPVITDQARASNFTNELGVGNRIRFLKNLSGLWLLNESMRHWEENQQSQSLPEILKQASSIEPVAFIDVTDSEFIAPGDMPQRISNHCEALHGVRPESPAEVVSVIMHSLAKSYAEGMRDLQEIVGLEVNKIFVTGGGSQNQLICQLTADYCKLPVTAGPVEATAMGNLAVQMMASENAIETLEDVRRIIMANTEVTNYEPSFQ